VVVNRVRALGRAVKSLLRPARPVATVTAGGARDAVRSRRELLAENPLLRQQLVVLRRGVKRPAFGPMDRLVLPHLDHLADAPFRFDVSFGLPELPREPGVLVIRGPRQAGKSTWLEGWIRRTVEAEGPGSALYLSGDELLDAQELTDSVRSLLPQYAATAPVRRLFIDEVTAVAGWEKALKVVLDRGELRRVLVVTTGSRASDLRRGAERLPGRKGNLERAVYWFTPVPFAEFSRVCGEVLGEDTLWGYVLSGGTPVGCAAVADTGVLPAYVVEMARDWILGECAASGRDRSSLLAVLECLCLPETSSGPSSLTFPW